MTTQIKPNVVRFGLYEFALHTQELRKAGIRIHLEGQPLAILQMLLERPGELVTREELQKRLWPKDTFVDFEHSLNAAVKRLRAALNDSADQPHYVETLARRGYRFIAPLNAAGAETGIVASVVPPSPAVAQTLSIARGRRVRLIAIAVFAVAVGGWGLRQWRHRLSAPAVPVIRSLAVLPLTNLSGDPSQEYVADGMTEALIGRLAGIHNLRVISRTSAMQFKNTHLSVPEIAKALHVDAVVEGSVIRDGNRIRVHAQLIRASTDEHFWSETYDRELPDVLALQSDVAQSIARRVEVTMTGEESARLRAARSVSPEVYESYLKGRFALDKANTKTDIEKSLAAFGEAIKRDPSFGPAYLGLADAYEELSTVFIGSPPEEARAQALAAAQKAVELDPDSVEAHVELARVRRFQWQWADSESEFNRALDLSPNNPAAHLGFATLLLSQGRIDEALASSELARRLDPMSVPGVEIGWILFCGHRYDEAIREFRSVVAVQPGDAGALWYLGFALDANHQPQEAVSVLENGLAVSGGSPGIMGVLVRAYAHAGRRADALRLLDELKKRKQAGYVPAAAFVNAYLGLSDYENAFRWLDQACKEHSPILLFIKTHPYFDPIRKDPRFKDLLHRVGLDQVR